MKALLITSGQPSVNPRLVKEADLLAESGFDVTVLYSYWNDWATEYDVGMLAEKKWKALRVGGSPTNQRLAYLLTRLLYKAAKIFNFLPIEWGIARSTFVLTREAKKHNADIYIAHNLGALPAAVKAARFYMKPCGFDAEDFHRNEVSDDAQSADMLLKKAIEDKYIPKVNYLTASSHQIAEAYRKCYPKAKPVVVLNVFSVSDAALPSFSLNDQSLKLFWFSQTVGSNRGLEEIAEAIKLSRNPNIELHLLGAVDQNFKSLLMQKFDKIYFHPPVPPNEVISFAAKFDIGLALERSEPLNRDLCLTNKLFTYLHAGLAIIASNTQAQSSFMTENSDLGFTYPIGDISRLAEIISSYNDRLLLSKHKQHSHQLAIDKFNWKIEGQKFLSAVKSTLKS